MRVEGLQCDKIDLAIQRRLKHVRKIEQGYISLSAGLKLHQHIDVAIGRCLATSHRTEHGEPADSKRKDVISNAGEPLSCNDGRHGLRSVGHGGSVLGSHEAAKAKWQAI
jgi:hypothetical protein